tara:strand:+ start:3795 stop:4394 length:600 start_codon:yes stop_codon:yes gene_type:complete
VLKLFRQSLRQLYDWTLHWADTPKALVALFAISIAESSFFPIPPDVLLIAIVGLQPSQWLRASTVTAVGSLVGAAIGYAIGALLMPVLGDPIITLYGAQAHWDHFVVLANQWGPWFLAGAAFTPIPFKVATIASGAIGMPLFQFLAISFIGRSARFFLVGGILRLFGARVRDLIESHFDLAAILFFLLFIGGFFVLRFI